MPIAYICEFVDLPLLPHLGRNERARHAASARDVPFDRTSILFLGSLNLLMT
jgi:hypothetical protein